jgi:syntaxin-binding protein 1
MGVSLINDQKEIIIDTIKNITNDDWKVLVVDEHSKKVIDNVAKEDDILNQNIASMAEHTCKEYKLGRMG